MKIRDFFGTNAEATTTSIKLFKEQPLNSLGQLIPVCMVAISVVGYIISLIQFAVKGGYSKQIVAFKGNLLGGVFTSLTKGTTGFLVSGVISKLLLTLTVLECIVLVISFFRLEGTAKKILLIVSFVLGLIAFGGAGFLLCSLYGVVTLSEEMRENFTDILSVFSNVQTPVLMNGLKITAFIGAAFLIAFVILLLTSKRGWMMKNCAAALLLTYIVIPLFLLLSENIFSAIGLFIIGIIVIIVTKILLKTTLSFSEYMQSTEVSGFETAGSRYRDNSKSSYESKNDYQKRIDYDLNTTFWRDKGGYGIAVPQADCIYMNDAVGQKAYVCTVRDYENGEVAIYNKRSRITNVPGCRHPKR